MGDADRDKFELHFRNLLNHEFGAAFVTSRVTIKFHELADKEVCRTITTPAKEPTFITVKDKNGQAVRKLYARSGNSSQEIPPDEMNTYFKERFH